MNARYMTAAMIILTTTPVTWAGPLLDTTTITARDPASGGEVMITSSVFEEPQNRTRFVYDVTNISYDPEPGATNAFSGFSIAWGVLPGPLAEDGLAPPGWTIDLRLDYGGVFVAEFTRPWADGWGIAVDETATFGFLALGPRYNLYGGPFGQFGFTHTQLGPQGEFWLRDYQYGMGIPVPCPEPGALALLGLAGIGLGRRRK